MEFTDAQINFLVAAVSNTAVRGSDARLVADTLTVLQDELAKRAAQNVPPPPAKRK